LLGRKPDWYLDTLLKPKGVDALKTKREARYRKITTFGVSKNPVLSELLLDDSRESVSHHEGQTFSVLGLGPSPHAYPYGSPTAI
jgi:hypothetical protein